MGEVKKQLQSTSLNESNFVATIKQLNTRLHEYLYSPENAFVAQNLERFENATNFKREQVECDSKKPKIYFS
jgi:hypothetical protein